MQAECPQAVPFRTQHPHGAVVTPPSVGLTDDFARRAGLYGWQRPCDPREIPWP